MAEAAGKKVIVKVKRQQTPREPARWEEFALNWRPSMNIIICLRDIAENPVTSDGEPTTPVTYDSNCLEEGNRRMTETSIAFVHARRVWDSRGRPTVVATASASSFADVAQAVPASVSP